VVKIIPCISITPCIEELSGRVVAASAQIRENREVFSRIRASMVEGTGVYHASRTTFSAFTVNKVRLKK
jgi:hypothetical protein